MRTQWLSLNTAGIHSVTCVHLVHDGDVVNLVKPWRINSSGKPHAWVGCCWLWRDRSRGCKGGDGGGKCLWREAGQPWKQGNTAESHIEDGTITIASLSPAGSISSWTIERLAHQIPDAPTQGTPLSDWCTTQQSRTPPRVPLQVPDKLIYREGPQQWGLLHVPDVSNNIEGLQARELLSTWTGRAMEKDW